MISTVRPTVPFSWISSSVSPVLCPTNCKFLFGTSLLTHLSRGRKTKWTKKYFSIDFPHFYTLVWSHLECNLCVTCHKMDWYSAAIGQQFIVSALLPSPDEVWSRHEQRNCSHSNWNVEITMSVVSSSCLKKTLSTKFYNIFN